jgi:hypothetical protein
MSLGYFEGNADDPIKEGEEESTFGFTKSQWVTDERVKGAAIHKAHSDRKVGHIIRPYIGRCHLPPHHEMLSCRGAIYLDDEEGRGVYKDIQEGRLDGLSVHIDHDVRGFPGVGEMITGRKLGHVGVLPNPRKKHCRITVRQGEDDANLLTMIIPMLSAATISPETATKTEPGFSLQPPLLPRDMASTPATPAAAPAAPVPAAVAPSPAAAAPAAPAVPTASPMEISSDVARATTMAEKISKFSDAELRKSAIEAEVMRGELEQLRAQQSASQKLTDERAKQESETRRKELTEKYKDVLPSIGIGLEGDKKDAQLDATFYHLLTDPASEKAGATKLLMAQLDLALKGRQENTELQKKLAEHEKRNQDQQMAFDALKRMRGGFSAPPSTAPTFPTSNNNKAEPAAAAAGAAPAAVPVDNRAQIEAALTAERQRTMNAATMSGGMLNPATLITYPSVQRVGGVDAKNITLLHSRPAMAGGALTRGVLVQQGSDVTGPMTGERLDTAFDKNKAALSTLKCLDTDNPMIQYDFMGRPHNVTTLFEGQGDSRLAPRGTYIYDTDATALYNTAVNRGIGRNYPTQNYADPDVLHNPSSHGTKRSKT